jgi:hypothetical protein
MIATAAFKRKQLSAATRAFMLKESAARLRQSRFGARVMRRKNRKVKHGRKRSQGHEDP